MALLVLSRQCKTCVFLPGNLMKLRPGRVADMMRECREVQGHIPCHETLVYTDEDDDEGESIVDYERSPVCKGFYDAHGQVSQIVRIAERLNAIEFVDPP